MTVSCDEKDNMTPFMDSKEEEAVKSAMDVKSNGHGGDGLRVSMEEMEKDNLETTRVEKEYTDKTTQYLAAGIVTIGAFCSGTFFSWTSAALPLLLQEDDNIRLKINAYEGSWIASLLALGAFAGAIPTGLIAERFGRKKTLLSLTIPMLMAWLLISLSTSVYCFYVGRFVGGVAVGALSVAVPPYVADLAQPTSRAALANFYQIQLAAGILFGYVAGLCQNVVILSLIAALIPVIYFLGFLFMPESPIYLMTQGKIDEAKNSLIYIRGIGCDLDEEIKAIKEYIRISTKNEGRFKDFVATKSNIKATIIAFSLMTFQQLTGITAIIFYMAKIFSGFNLFVSPIAATIIVGSVKVFSTYISAKFLTRTGRRPMLIYSFLLMGVSIVLLGAYYHVGVSGWNLDNYNWFPVMCLSVFVSFYSIGVGPIPWLMLREIFPSPIQRRATAISAGINWFMAFFVSKFYQNMVDSIGTGWVLSTFGFSCGFAALFVYYAVPETKGKKLEHIQQELNGDQRVRRLFIEIESVSFSD